MGPVTDNVTIFNYIEIAEDSMDLRHAIEQIDYVHSVPAIHVPTLKLRFAQLDGEGNGESGYRCGDGLCEVAILRDDPGPLSECVHQVGNFIFEKFLGGTDADVPVQLEGFFAAVGSSKRVEHIQVGKTEVFRMYRKYAYYMSPSQENEISRELDVIFGLLKPSELFACAYAQFIAGRSGDLIVLAQNNALARMARDRDPPMAWHEADFAPIDRALGELLGSLGWMKDTEPV